MKMLITLEVDGEIENDTETTTIIIYKEKAVSAIATKEDGSFFLQKLDDNASIQHLPSHYQQQKA